MISFHDLEKKVDNYLFGNDPLWTIAGEDGTPIISFKSLLKAEYGSNGTVVSEPIEQNSFTSYNKTTEPREYHFELALQLPNNNFSAALAKLEELKKGVDLFSFVTPFTTFTDLSLEGYSTVFESVSSMMVVSLDCKEIKQVEQGYTNVKVNDATPIGTSDAKNPDNVDVSDTGMTGTDVATEAEEKTANQSILRRAGVSTRRIGGGLGG